MWVLCASPLFDFWLDEEPWEEDFQAVGQLARELGYSAADVLAMYWQEVLPAIMGTWGRIDPASPAWLEEKIRQRPRFSYWVSWLLRPWWGWVACEYWRRIARSL